MLDGHALVLNRHWMPLTTITVRQALTLVCRSAARVICPRSYEVMDLARWIDHSVEAPREESVVRSATLALHVPEVILLAEYGRAPRRQIAFARKNLQRRDQGTCQYCGVANGAGSLTIDHVVPRSRGGASSWENCVLACVRCNTRKGNAALRDSGLKLNRTPKSPKWSPLHDYSGGIPGSWRSFLTE